MCIGELNEYRLGHVGKEHMITVSAHVAVSLAEKRDVVLVAVI